MNLYTLWFWKLIFLIQISSLTAQSSSYQISADLQNVRIAEIEEGENDIPFFLIQKLDNTSFEIASIDWNSKKMIGETYDFRANYFGGLTDFLTIEKNDRYIGFSESINGEINLNLCKLNESDLNQWIRVLPQGGGNGGFSVTEDEVVAFSEAKALLTHKDVINFYTFDKLSGDTKIKLGWKFDPDLIVSNRGIPEGRRIAKLQTNNYVMGGHFNGEETSFLVKADQNGLPINAKSFSFSEAFLSGFEISKSGDLYFVLSSSEVFTFSESKRNVIIIKFDDNLDIEWSRVFYSDKMNPTGLSLNFDENGDLVIAYYTSGVYPVIYAKLDSDGVVVSEIGYPLYRPIVKTLNNGASVFSSRKHFDSDGNTFEKNVIAKTDLSGGIDDCETYQTHLKSKLINVDLETFQIDTFHIPEPDWRTPLEGQPVEYSFEPFCDVPAPPHPNFQLPDTLCLGNCLATDSTNNANAHGVEWNLEGDDLQLKVEDSLQFNFCPTEVGTYTLRQTIWFLGVDYSFEKIVEIIPPLEVSLPNDTMFCDAPATIELTSNRPLQNIEWSSGETTSTALIYDSGQYDVVADDGYCQANTSANYEFIFDKIDTTLALQIPDSATACAMKLPFELRPESEYISLFQKENELVDSVLTFSQSGIYKIIATIDGCVFSKTFQLKTGECAANIYVPSAFSPNDDGINDSFLPLGSDIQPIRLKIYDRWGGKLFESTETQIAWNGKFNEKSAQQGVYVFQFEYVNLLTGLEEELSGEVTVMR